MEEKKLVNQKMKKDEDVTKLNDKELLASHFYAHSAYNRLNDGKEFGDWTIDDVIAYHKRVVNEMLSRGFEHHRISDLDNNVPVTNFLKGINRVKDKQRVISEELGISKDDIISELTDQDLLFRVALMTTLYEMEQIGVDVVSWSVEDIINHYILITEELDKREIEYPLDNPVEEEAMPFRKALAPIEHSGNEEGDEITLEEVMPYFKSFMLRQPFIYLVGGIVNHGKTKGDIDILIKGKFPSSFSIPLKFRIFRSFPQKYWNRLHILEDEYHGPFTCNIPLGDLGFIRYPEDELHIMSLAENEINVTKQLNGAETEAAKADAEKSEKEDEIKPFRYFYPLKSGVSALEGYRKGEKYTIDQVIEYYTKLSEKLKIEKGIVPVYVQKKYDGLRQTIHKVGNKVKILTDSGTDSTARFPILVNELKKNSYPNSFILDSETEMWIKGVHQPREKAAAYVREKTKPDDSNIVFNVFDCLYFDGNDLHKISQDERLKVLDKIPFKQSVIEKPDVKHKLNLTPTFEAKTINELVSAVKKCTESKASEGAMIKIADSEYPLTGQSDDIVKFKKFAEVHVVIWKIDETKTKGVYTFWIGFRILPNEKVADEDVIVINNERYLKAGKTFNTAMKAKVGDIITVKFHTLNLIRNPETGEVRLTVYEPDVYEERGPGEEADSITSAINVGRESGLLQEKIEKQFIQKQENPYLVYPSEDKTYKYVVQQHFRGRSAHADFRMENLDKEFLIGWTLNDLIAGSIKEPVMSMKMAKDIVSEPEKYFKINWKTGEWRQRKKRGAKELVNVEIVSEKKTRQPIGWMKFEGITDPGTVGATRNYPGVFVLVDEGTIEYGSQKAYFHEYFPKGGAFNYRVMFRRLKTPFAGKFLNVLKELDKDDAFDLCLVFEYLICDDNLEEELEKDLSYYEVHRKIDLSRYESILDEAYSNFDFIETSYEQFEPDEYLTVICKQKLPPLPATAESVLETGWFFIKPLEQRPYILTERAVELGFMPPDGISAIIANMRRRIPKEFQYWNMKGEEALNARNSLVKAIKDNKLDLGFERLESKELDDRFNIDKLAELTETNAKFTLSYQTFQAETKPVREGPSRKQWNVFIDTGGYSLMHFILEDDPLVNSEISADFDREPNDKAMIAEGNIPPGHFLNDTKDTPSFIEIIEKNKKAIVMVNNPSFKRIQFKGSKLAGVWIAFKRGGLWLFQRSQEAPSASKYPEQLKGGE